MQARVLVGQSKAQAHIQEWQTVLKRRAKLRRRVIRYTLLGINFLLFVGVLFFVMASSRSNQASSTTIAASSSSSLAQANPLDQLSSADIAESVANMTNLPEATAVRNQADTVNAELAIAPAGDVVAAKPQVVATALKDRQDIQTYITVANDTLASLATKFNVSANSIQWSNNLGTTTLVPGMKLLIPPVSGIVYTVQAGDTPQSLAQKYGADANQIISFNDAELSGLTPGEQIVIPGGHQASGLTVSYGVYGGLATYSGSISNNGYDFGYCTYWVALRRAQVGEPVPSNLGNASSWGYLARAYGLSTGNVPRTYAAAVTSTEGEGHVVFVESVNPDGSINISEMNRVGWDVVDHRTISAAEAATYTYIY